MRVHIGWAMVLALLTAVGGYAAAKPTKTPKGYIVAEVQVTDAEAYKPTYQVRRRRSRNLVASIWCGADGSSNLRGHRLPDVL